MSKKKLNIPNASGLITSFGDIWSKTNYGFVGLPGLNLPAKIVNGTIEGQFAWDSEGWLWMYMRKVRVWHESVRNNSYPMIFRACRENFNWTSHGGASSQWAFQCFSDFTVDNTGQWRAGTVNTAWDSGVQDRGDHYVRQAGVTVGSPWMVLAHESELTWTGNKCNIWIGGRGHYSVETAPINPSPLNFQFERQYIPRYYFPAAINTDEVKKYSLLLSGQDMKFYKEDDTEITNILYLDSGSTFKFRIELNDPDTYSIKNIKDNNGTIYHIGLDGFVTIPNIDSDLFITVETEAAGFEPKVIYNSTTKTLTFKYTNQTVFDPSETVYDIPTTRITPAWEEHADDIESVVIDESFLNYQPTSCYRWFGHVGGYIKLTSLSLIGLDTSQVTDMEEMFAGLDHVTELTIPNFNIDNLDHASRMFKDMTLVETIYTDENFTLADVDDADNVFINCSNNLVGGNGTTWSSSHIGKDYAIVDTTAHPGYFTKYVEPSTKKRKTKNGKKKSKR